MKITPSYKTIWQVSMNTKAYLSKLRHQAIWETATPVLCKYWMCLIPPKNLHITPTSSATTTDTTTTTATNTKTNTTEKSHFY